MGADEVVDYRTEKFWEMDKYSDQFDFALDSTKEAKKCLSTVKPGTGKVVSIAGGLLRIANVDASERDNIDGGGKGLSCFLRCLLRNVIKLEPYDVSENAESGLYCDLLVFLECFEDRQNKCSQTFERLR